MALTTQTANLFELQCGDTRITYSTSSFAGTPRLNHSDADGDQSFSGEAIDVQQTALNTEVTVTLAAVPDLQTITLTLLLPDIRLDAGGEAEFDTLAIKTTNHTTIAGPPAGAGQSYEAIALHGVAKVVDF